MSQGDVRNQPNQVLALDPHHESLVSVVAVVPMQECHRLSIAGLGCEAPENAEALLVMSVQTDASQSCASIPLQSPVLNWAR